MAQDLYKQWYDKKNSAPDQPHFKIGDQVLRARTELGNAKQHKLEPYFNRPFYIH